MLVVLAALFVLVIVESLYVIYATAPRIVEEKPSASAAHFLAPLKVPRANAAPLADNATIGLVRGPAEGAVPGGKLIAVYKLSDGDLVAVVIRGGDLYGVAITVRNGSPQIRGVVQGREQLFESLREVRNISSVGINAIMTTNIDIYEVVIPTNSGNIYLYKVDGKMTKASEDYAFQAMRVEGNPIWGYFTLYLPNEVGVNARGLWVIDYGRAVLYLEDRSYTWSSGPVDKCSFTSSATFNEYAGGVKADAVYAMYVGPATRKAELISWLTIDKDLHVYPDGHADDWVSFGIGCTAWS